MEEKTISASFAEDLRKGETHSKLYDILMANGFDPIDVNLYYNPQNLVGVSHFKFSKYARIPTEEQLKTMFKDLNLLDYRIFSR